MWISFSIPTSYDGMLDSSTTTSTYQTGHSALFSARVVSTFISNDYMPCENSTKSAVHPSLSPIKVILLVSKESPTWNQGCLTGIVVVSMLGTLIIIAIITFVLYSKYHHLDRRGTQLPELQPFPSSLQNHSNHEGSSKNDKGGCQPDFQLNT